MLEMVLKIVLATEIDLEYYNIKNRHVIYPIYTKTNYLCKNKNIVFIRNEFIKLR